MAKSIPKETLAFGPNYVVLSSFVALRRCNTCLPCRQPADVGNQFCKRALSKSLRFLGFSPTPMGFERQDWGRSKQPLLVSTTTRKSHVSFHRVLGFGWLQTHLKSGTAHSALSVPNLTILDDCWRPLDASFLRHGLLWEYADRKSNGFNPNFGCIPHFQTQPYSQPFQPLTFSVVKSLEPQELAHVIQHCFGALWWAHCSQKFGWLDSTPKNNALKIITFIGSDSLKIAKCSSWRSSPKIEWLIIFIHKKRGTYLPYRFILYWFHGIFRFWTRLILVS